MTEQAEILRRLRQVLTEQTEILGGYLGLMYYLIATIPALRSHCAT